MVVLNFLTYPFPEGPSSGYFKTAAKKIAVMTMLTASAAARSTVKIDAKYWCFCCEDKLIWITVVIAHCNYAPLRDMLHFPMSITDACTILLRCSRNEALTSCVSACCGFVLTPGRREGDCYSSATVTRTRRLLIPLSAG